MSLSLVEFEPVNEIHVYEKSLLRVVLSAQGNFRLSRKIHSMSRNIVFFVMSTSVCFARIGLTAWLQTQEARPLSDDTISERA